MATRYTRNRFSFVSSLASDYSRPREKDEWEITSSTMDETPYIPVECDTGGTTVVLSHLGTAPFTTASPRWLAIYNEDATNFARAVWYSQRGSNTYAASDINFNDAGPDTITRDAGTSFVASTLDVVIGGYVWVTGATVAANNSTPLLVQNVAAATITLGTTMVVSGGDDAGTPTLYSVMRNSQRITAGEFLYVGPVFSLADLVITANTASVMCRVYYGAT